MQPYIIYETEPFKKKPNLFIKLTSHINTK